VWRVCGVTLTTAAVVCLLGVAGAARDATAGAKTSLVTPAQAHAAIATLWQAREHALVSRDLTTLNKIDTGSQRLTDIERVREATMVQPYYYARGPRTLRRAMLYVPRQTRYPLYFTADVQARTADLPTVSGGAVTAMLVVTKSSAFTPWRLTMQVWDSGYQAPQPQTPPTVDADGYGTDPAAPPARSGAASRWLPRLAAYFNQIKKTGKQPLLSDFVPGPLTAHNGLEKRPNGSTVLGVRRTFVFRLGTFGGPWVLNVDGTMNVCGDIVETTASTPPTPNQVLIQSRSRDKWGPEIAPGLYRRITATWEWAVCVYPYGSGGLLGVGGNLSGGYIIHSTGHRIAPL
jgi:hypothetical protein